MAKVPDMLLQLAYKLATKNFGNLAEVPAEKIPHIKVIAKAYTEGEPLEVIIALYLQATENVDDDNIAGRVSEVLSFVENEVPKILKSFSAKPAKEVLTDLLNGIAIPDFNDEAGDEAKVIDLINDLMKELTD